MRRKRIRSGNPSTLRSGVTASVNTMNRMVQPPVWRVMYSIGLAVRFWFQARQQSQKIGARPAANTSTLVQRFFNMLVVLFEIHSVVQAGNLVAVTVEHQGRPLAEFPQPPLARLAPPRMVHLRIDVGVEPVLGRIGHIPRGGRLAAHQADLDNRFDALEAVLPGQDHAHWRAILDRKSTR